MTYQDIASMIEGIGLPFAYYQFDNKTGQQPPFICFYYPESVNFMADGSVYQRIDQLVIELYTNEKDFINEQKTERALRDAGLAWNKEETYIDEEKMYMVAYSMEVLINE